MAASRYSQPTSRWRARALSQAEDRALAVGVATPASKAKQKELPPRWPGRGAVSQSVSSLLLQLSNLSPRFSTRCHPPRLLPLGHAAEEQSRSTIRPSGQRCRHVILRLTCLGMPLPKRARRHPVRVACVGAVRLLCAQQRSRGSAAAAICRCRRVRLRCGARTLTGWDVVSAPNFPRPLQIPLYFQIQKNKNSNVAGADLHGGPRSLKAWN